MASVGGGETCHRRRVVKSRQYRARGAQAAGHRGAGGAVRPHRLYRLRRRGSSRDCGAIALVGEISALGLELKYLFTETGDGLLIRQCPALDLVC